MRKPLLILMLPVLLALGAESEVIHLKNGRAIWADSVREQGSHLEYEVGDNTYAIPKTLVERVEAGGVRPAYSSAGGGSQASRELPAYTPNDGLPGEGGLAGKIVHDGRVDNDALSKFELEGKPEVSATAYFIAGKHELERGDLNQARQYFEAALRFQPDNSTILNYYAVLLVRTGNSAQALPYAERSVRVAATSPDALTVLGFVQFSCDRTNDAIRAWKRSLALRPDPTVEQLVAKAEREAKAEADFTERESSHFTLRFEGKETSESLRRDLLATLETDYEDLVRDLGTTPRSSILVVLYTDQAFFDVTHAPSWTGAINDGKLRIPVNGVSSVTSELARVLKHELAHSFINQITGGRCPHWLNEGVAQLLEPKSLDGNGRRLAQLFREQHEIPFNTMEGSFMRFSTIEAMLAYDESLAAAQYIQDTYGLSDLQRILERIGQGSSTEAALRTTIHSSYSDLDSEVGKFLASRYGS